MKKEDVARKMRRSDAKPVSEKDHKLSKKHLKESIKFNKDHAKEHMKNAKDDEKTLKKRYG